MRMFKIIVVVFLFLSLGSPNALAGVKNTSFNDGFIQYNIQTDDGECWCVCYRLLDKTIQNISIPDSVKYRGIALPVRSIADTAFIGCSAQFIKLPSNIKEIGDYSFASCFYLQEINIPDGVVHIGRGAFRSCSRLQIVNIPLCLKIIEQETFYNCLSLKAIDIPEGVETIEDNAFAFCGLEKIHIPSTVKMMGSWNRSSDVFLGCGSMVSMSVDSKNDKYDSRSNCNAIIETMTNTLISGCGTTKIPSTVEKIDVLSFAFKTNLKKIYIPKRVSRIECGAFAGCDNLKVIKVSHSNKVYDSRGNCNAIINSNLGVLHTSCPKTIIPSNIEIIGDFAYAGSCIVSLIIPDNIKTIGANAFMDCRRLQYISFPNTLERIGEKAFSGCNALNIIDIPPGIERIGSGTFKDCLSLEYINMPSSIADISDDAFEGCHILK